MTVNDIETLYDYGYWANGKLFEVMAGLSDEEFTRSVAGSFGSLRDTLVHSMSVERGWLTVCAGHDRAPGLAPQDFADVQSVRSTWSSVERDIRGFLATLEDDDLTRDIEFEVREGESRSLPLGELLHHLANHGVHHRGQIALLLRQLGYAPGNVDILFYYSETHGDPWVWPG